MIPFSHRFLLRVNLPMVILVRRWPLSFIIIWLTSVRRESPLIDAHFTADCKRHFIFLRTLIYLVGNMLCLSVTRQAKPSTSSWYHNWVVSIDDGSFYQYSWSRSTYSQINKLLENIFIFFKGVFFLVYSVVESSTFLPKKSTRTLWNSVNIREIDSPTKSILPISSLHCEVSSYFYTQLSRQLSAEKSSIVSIRDTDK